MTGPVAVHDRADGEKEREEAETVGRVGVGSRAAVDNKGVAEVAAERVERCNPYKTL